MAVDSAGGFEDMVACVPGRSTRASCISRTLQIRSQAVARYLCIETIIFISITAGSIQCLSMLGTQLVLVVQMRNVHWWM